MRAGKAKSPATAQDGEFVKTSGRGLPGWQTANRLRFSAFRPQAEGAKPQAKTSAAPEHRGIKIVIVEIDRRLEAVEVVILDLLSIRVERRDHRRHAQLLIDVEVARAAARQKGLEARRQRLLDHLDGARELGAILIAEVSRGARVGLAALDRVHQYPEAQRGRAQ